MTVLWKRSWCMLGFETGRGKEGLSFKNSGICVHWGGREFVIFLSVLWWMDDLSFGVVVSLRQPLVWISWKYQDLVSLVVISRCREQNLSRSGSAVLVFILCCFFFCLHWHAWEDNNTSRSRSSVAVGIALCQPCSADTPSQLPDAPSYIFTPLVVTVALCSRGGKPCMSKQSVKSVLCFFHAYIFYFNRCSFFWVSLSMAGQQTQVAGGWEGKGTPWAAVASHSHWEAITLFKIWIWYPCLGCNANDWVHVRSVL